MVEGRVVIVSALQFACSDDVSTNVDTAERLVRAAHQKGAKIILIQELFEGYYFCQAQREDFFQRAKPYKDHPTILRMQNLAKELGVEIPVSFFEEANNAHYNSVAVIDADGTDLGLYRKSHIPDGPGYQEKFYFNPGDTGFKVFQTKFAKIGVGICWDQWFPEAARAMALQGAEVLFYPTAIGSEPQDDGLDSRDHWKRVMQGHAGANLVPLVASNRIGKEIIQTEHGKSEITFYGNSFIAGPTGEIVTTADDNEEAVLVAEFDLDKIKSKRYSWGVFRDRRPDLYKRIIFLPGYQEKFYFNPGDTGFKVFQTKFAKIGVGICWDQWFPEAARAMALKGAEILFYPTAIGSEPQDDGLDSRDHWKRVMQGHAGANLVPLVASNRIGKEIIQTEHGKSEIAFYGNSFIAGPTGEIVATADDNEEAVLVAEFDLDKIKSKRHSWGVFRDRRPDLYKVLLTLDGSNISL
ncbi:unnamed protein product [Fraxinus pennsylvanica]|uniref:N-carbamoylputrescine amidase n=1 Tax=Fraxinus pennsylvanica TaxID=56036 RepID=A0AAD2A4C9_9LAMI|nr:unnamed protein product [Fraxinus pennsylvanica]